MTELFEEIRIMVQEISIAHQMVRYGIVGVFNNLLGYLIYLIVTSIWVEPIFVSSFLYLVGAITSYVGNSKYTFSYQSKQSNVLIRYIIAHALGYLINVLMLYALWEKLKYPHQIVQAFAIFVVAGFLFVVFRYFVFGPAAVFGPNE